MSKEQLLVCYTSHDITCLVGTRVISTHLRRVFDRMPARQESPDAPYPIVAHVCTLESALHPESDADFRSLHAEVIDEASRCLASGTVTHAPLWLSRPDHADTVPAFLADLRSKKSAA